MVNAIRFRLSDDLNTPMAKLESKATTASASPPAGRGRSFASISEFVKSVAEFANANV
jgi:hypothetical protein